MIPSRSSGSIRRSWCRWSARCRPAELRFSAPTMPGRDADRERPQGGAEEQLERRRQAAHEHVVDFLAAADRACPSRRPRSATASRRTAPGSAGRARTAPALLATVAASLTSALASIAARMASPGISWAMTKASTVTSARMTSACSSRDADEGGAPAGGAVRRRSASLLCASLNHSGCDQNQTVAVLQEALVVPALDLLAVRGHGLVHHIQASSKVLVQHLLEVPVDLSALVEVDLADGRLRSGQWPRGCCYGRS